jgi:hypothetical protein
MLKYNSNSVYKAQTRSNRLDPPSNCLGDVEIFRKPYLSHPDSKLDVLYMNLDLLDDTYLMGKSKLPFKEFGHGGLTGVKGGLTGLAQTCHFWVSTFTDMTEITTVPAQPLSLRGEPIYMCTSPCNFEKF